MYPKFKPPVEEHFNLIPLCKNDVNIVHESDTETTFQYYFMGDSLSDMPVIWMTILTNTDTESGFEPWIQSWTFIESCSP